MDLQAFCNNTKIAELETIKGANARISLTAIGPSHPLSSFESSFWAVSCPSGKWRHCFIKDQNHLWFRQQTVLTLDFFAIPLWFQAYNHRSIITLLCSKIYLTLDLKVRLPATFLLPILVKQNPDFLINIFGSWGF